MSKNKKKRRNKSKARKRQNVGQENLNNFRFPDKENSYGEGILWRDYPPEAERLRISRRLKKIPEEQRTSSQWWRIGEYAVLQGILDEDDGKINEGLDSLTRGVSLPEPNAACLMDLAWVLMYKRLDAMAIPYLQRATDLVPASRDAWSLLAWAYVGTSQGDAAINAITNAIELRQATQADRDLLASLVNGDDPQTLRRSIGMQKLDLEALSVGRYGKEESWKAAVQYCKHILDSDPDNPDALFSYATARYALKKYDLAVPVLKRLLEIDPGHSDSYAVLALISTKSGELDSAIELYKTALNHHPTHMLSLTNLASALQEKGLFYDARPLLEMALKPENEESWLYPIALDLAGSSVGTLEEDFEKEIELHKAALERDPQNIKFVANLIVALISNGESAEAKRLWNRDYFRLSKLENNQLLGTLVEASTNDSAHPASYLELVSHLHSHLGWKAMRPFLQKAWKNRSKVDIEDKPYFITTLATYSSHAGDVDSALEIWKSGFDLSDGDAFRTNYAVELSNAGHYEDALAFFESVPMNQPRSWTIRGNLKRSVGNYTGALEDYTIALDKDERFLLPISNGIEMAIALRRPDAIKPFVAVLKSRCSDDAAAKVIHARAALYEGKAKTACDIFNNVLFDEDQLVNPQDFGERIGDSKDLSLFGDNQIQSYKTFGMACLRAQNHQVLSTLYETIQSWPQWMDGDWIILAAESERLRGNRTRALEMTADMPSQPPPLLTRALCAIGDGNYLQAEALAIQALDVGESIDGYVHPEGKPGAVAKAIISVTRLRSGADVAASKNAAEALELDPSCALAAIALSDTLVYQGNTDSQLNILSDAIACNPGHPALNERFIRACVDQGKFGLAKEMLDVQRNLLNEQGEELLATQLAEFIALGQLEVQGFDGESDIDWTELSWATQLDDKSRKWLKCAIISSLKGETLLTAEAMYLCKIAEHELVMRVVKPFREHLLSNQITLSGKEVSKASKQLRDFTLYVSGNGKKSAPSLGGIVRALNSARIPFQADEAYLITIWRDFLKSLTAKHHLKVAAAVFSERLTLLADLRNRIAHIGDPSVEDYVEVRNFLLSGMKPGAFFEALGLK